jgi:hypothetical protein
MGRIPTPTQPGKVTYDVVRNKGKESVENLRVQ